ncbi:MAG: hypothetical protein ABR956_14090 [Terracidiphilus sp.]|jgi:hypothetical protein
MWEGAHALLTEHRKALGIVGDSLTFAGSLLLALEALLRKTERISVDRKKTIVKHFKYAEDRQGEPVSPEAVERKWLKLWEVASKTGTIVLALGFAFLLAHRIFVE